MKMIKSRTASSPLIGPLIGRLMGCPKGSPLIEQADEARAYCSSKTEAMQGGGQQGKHARKHVGSAGVCISRHSSAFAAHLLLAFLPARHMLAASRATRDPPQTVHKITKISTTKESECVRHNW
jgi:hypothetical protein